MAQENTGLQKTVTKVLENGDEVKIQKMTIDGLCGIIGYLRDLSLVEGSPDKEKKGLLSMFLDDIQDVDLENRKDLASELMKWVARVPDVLPQITSAATGYPVEKTSLWTPRDTIKVLRASIEINDWDGLLKDLLDFFGLLGRTVGEVVQSLRGPKTSS